MTFSSQTFDRFALLVSAVSLLAALPLAAAMFIGQSL